MFGVFWTQASKTTAIKDTVLGYAVAEAFFSSLKTQRVNTLNRFRRGAILWGNHFALTTPNCAENRQPYPHSE